MVGQPKVRQFSNVTAAGYENRRKAQALTSPNTRYIIRPGSLTGGSKVLFPKVLSIGAMSPG